MKEKFTRIILPKLRTKSSLFYGLLISLPPILLIFLLAKYSVNVPFWDSWELVTILEKIHNGTVTFGDFFAQHNEHRILFPRLIMVGLANLTHWNALYEIATSVVLALASFGFLYLILRRTFTKKINLAISLVLVSTILFSPIQFENWMWGWQIQWFLNVLGLVVAVWSLSTLKSSPITKLIIAGAAATVATYSLASGFFVWLVCVPIFFFSPHLKKLLPIWIALASLVIASHYIGYQDPQYHPSKLLFLGDPLGLLEYFMIYIVRPLATDFLVSTPMAVAYIGIIVGIVSFFITRHSKGGMPVLMPWISIALYSIFAGLSTALSRLGFGLEQAYSNRYITLSCLLLISTVVGLLKLIESMSKKEMHNRKVLRYACILVLSCLVLFSGINIGKGITQMQERHEYLLIAKNCAQNARSQEDECLLLLYPNKGVVWERLQYIRQVRWADLKPLDK